MLRNYGIAADGQFITPPINQAPVNELIRYPGRALAMSRPNIPVDPSDPTTWRQPIVFT